MKTNKFNQLVGIPVENWQPRAKPTQSILQGHYGYIEPLSMEKYGEKLFANLLMENQGESWTYLPYGPFTKIEEFHTWIKTISETELDTQLYAILNNEKNPVGVAGYLRINPNHGVIEIGHLHFSKLLQRTQLATEAMYLMMRHAFDDLGYRRYEWKCNSLNEPSRQAALRFGFTFEGIFRQCNVFKGFNRDTAWFSIIHSEWPAIKEKFERWLDPSNFDKNGNQILRLNEIKIVEKT